MGLAHRIIPTILCRGRTLVKGEQFNSWRSVGVAAQAVRIHQARGCDEVVLLDITATAEGRGPDLSMVEELSAGCFMPLAVGGGVRSLEHVRDLLRAGADKVVIGTAAIEDPALIHQVASAVGCQAVVVSVEVKQGRVWGYCGTRETSMNPVEFAGMMQAQGAGEILLTSIERDGSMLGYDLETLRQIAAAVNVPVIASGGAGCYEHMREAIEAGASAVAAGALFIFTDCTPKGAAQYLHEHNIEARI